MSNGYYRLARVETNDGNICIDQGWGGYADFSVSIQTTGGTDRLLASQEIALTREQYGELLRQMNEYGSSTADTSSWTAQRLDALADRTGTTGVASDDGMPF
jgi:hypothetical protein